MTHTTTEAEALRVARAIWDWACWAFSTGPSAPDWSDDPDWLHRDEAIKLGRAAIGAIAATLKRDGFFRVTEPGAIVDISSPNACVKISAPLAYVKITGLSCVVEVAGVYPPPDRDWERVLRASVPYRWKPTVSAVGAAQSYIAELEAALEGLLAHSYAEQCQECGIGRSPPWLQAREALEP